MQIYAPKSFCLDIVIKSPKKKNIVFVAFLFSFWILLCSIYRVIHHAIDGFQ